MEYAGECKTCGKALSELTRELNQFFGGDAPRRKPVPLKLTLEGVENHKRMGHDVRVYTCYRDGQDSKWRCTGRSSGRDDTPCPDAQQMTYAEAMDHHEAHDHDCEEA